MPSGGLAGTVGQKTENRKRTKLDLESGSPTKKRPRDKSKTCMLLIFVQNSVLRPTKVYNRI